MLRVAVVCGGPSLERGISLNSARSVLDHLPSENLEVFPVYVDQELNFYAISMAQLYSNTPADFDFKLERLSKRLNGNALSVFFRDIDLVFPVIHGAFGEDGQLQEILEELKIPYVGSDAACCQTMFHKSLSVRRLKEFGFPALDSVIISKRSLEPLAQITHFFEEYALSKVIVKPESGGSSIGVSAASSPEEAFEKCKEIFDWGIDEQVLIESFCTGIEFTVIVFQSISGSPVALIPTEIEIRSEFHPIFDYRKKYLPTDNTLYHTPPRFSDPVIQEIRAQAERIFNAFNMRDCARLDGWVMPDNTIYFTDLNPVSGMEQNSFLFRQASIVGMSHQQALQYIICRACARTGVPFSLPFHSKYNQKNLVHVLFGGSNAERQVSLMSGTNVWLKLLKSDRYAPVPFLYDYQGNIWELSYSYALNHTVEEVYSNCIAAEGVCTKIDQFVSEIQQRLGMQLSGSKIPLKMSLNQFIEKTQKDRAFVFIAMHGGEGEDGTLQKIFEEAYVPYNGSDPHASALCMNKYATGRVIVEGQDPDILALPKKTLSILSTRQWSSFDFKGYWKATCEELAADRLIIKPQNDGCSAGIVLLENETDLELYCHHVHGGASFIPPDTFSRQAMPIEMPRHLTREYLLEPYIETDLVIAQQKELNHLPRTGWLELTVGVLEERGIYHSLNPSITIAEGAVLSVEEKFQGGTGINITPPPENVISVYQTEKIKRLIEKAASLLGVKNYARIDIFFNRLTEKMILIEANSLPALTPSTVIYHQGLAENPPIAPRNFLEKIIDAKLAIR